MNLSHSPLQPPHKPTDRRDLGDRAACFVLTLFVLAGSAWLAWQFLLGLPWML